MKKALLLGKIALVGGLMLVSTQSCRNLDENLYDQVDESVFPKSGEEFIAALGGAYTNLYNVAGHNGFFSDQEVSSDEAMIPQRGGDWYDGGQWLRMHRHEFTPSEESFNNGWVNIFKVVSDCNRLIELFEESGDPNAPAFIAELRGLRALAYYWALDLWGNVPIVTKHKEAEKQPVTSSRTEVYNFIHSEIDAVASLLTKDNGGTAYGRVNYWTVRAIQAKMYLNAAVYTGTANWTAAQAACDEIINSGKFGVDANYRSIFATDNGGAKEMIYAIPYDRVFAPGFVLPQQTLHYASQATFDLEEQPWNGYCTLADFYNAYEDGDERKANILAGPQYSSAGIRLQDSGAEANDPDGKDLTFTPEINEHFPNCLRQAGGRIGKFQFKFGNNRNLSNDFPVFRYADVLMMKAEALWHQDNSSADALALVNQIRTRAKAAPIAALTPDALLAERGREFFYEGWRRNDLIRFGKFNEARAYKPASDPHFNIFPIPQPQRDANPNLAQNPGY